MVGEKGLVRAEGEVRVLSFLLFFLVFSSLCLFFLSLLLLLLKIKSRLHLVTGGRALCS